MKWTNTKIHVPCQAITDNTEFFLVARLIKDKADASSTVNQLKRDMRVVCMELKFDPKYKSAVFSAKYLKSEIEFEGHHLLSVCCVFVYFLLHILLLNNLSRFSHQYILGFASLNNS